MPEDTPAERAPEENAETRRLPRIDTAPHTPEHAAPTRAADAEPAADWRSLLRPSRAQVVVGLVLCLVAIGVMVQLRARNDDDAYATARRADLVQILDGLNAESRRLDEDLRELEQTREELRTGADRELVAREEATRREENLGILAGTLPAVGPGVRIVIDDPRGAVSDAVLVDAVQELRDAGAEAIEINNSIRVVASTAFGQGPDGPTSGGTAITRPIVIEAIGDPNNLEEGARFRGGLVSAVTGDQVGGTVTITRESEVRVESLHSASENQYARPAR